MKVFTCRILLTPARIILAMNTIFVNKIPHRLQHYYRKQIGGETKILHYQVIKQLLLKDCCG